MDKLVESFERLAANYGPTVVDAALGAARVEGISYLFSSAIWFGLAYLAYRFGNYLHHREYDGQFNGEFGVLFGHIFLVVGALFAAAGLWAVLDPWVWTAIFQPDLYLAKRAFNL